jgi:hypothetical protein
MAGRNKTRFAGDGDTTGVANEESDQKGAIPLVERDRRGLKRGLVARDRKP